MCNYGIKGNGEIVMIGRKGLYVIGGILIMPLTLVILYGVYIVIMHNIWYSACMGIIISGVIGGIIITEAMKMEPTNDKVDSE